MGGCGQVARSPSTFLCRTDSLVPALRNRAPRPAPAAERGFPMSLRPVLLLPFVLFLLAGGRQPGALRAAQPPEAPLRLALVDSQAFLEAQPPTPTALPSFEGRR